MAGKFIVFEGIEGCGKTTQLARSQHWLAQSGWLGALTAAHLIQDVVITREPGGTELGGGIRQLLLTPTEEAVQDRAELLLYAADRAQHVDSYLRPHLAQGHLILCDRYTDSTVAYQGFGRGLDRSLIDQLNAIATGGLTPDLTIWLDLEVEEGLARAQRRGKRDRLEQADLDFHRRVYTGFATLAESEPDRVIPIDAHGSELEVAERVEKVLHHMLTRWFGAIV